MSNKNSASVRVGFLILGMVVSLAITLPWLPIWEPEPYTDVEVSKVEIVGNKLLVDSTFVKNECVFNRLATFGNIFGTLVNLEWENTDGGQGDRLEGRQRLVLLISLGKETPQSVEIRTRHLCHGVVIDKVFAVVEVPSDED